MTRSLASPLFAFLLVLCFTLPLTSFADAPGGGVINDDGVTSVASVDTLVKIASEDPPVAPLAGVGFIDDGRVVDPAGGGLVALVTPIDGQIAIGVGGHAQASDRPSSSQSQTQWADQEPDAQNDRGWLRQSMLDTDPECGILLDVDSGVLIVQLE